MKLSKREQRMLIFVVFFAMWVLSVSYVIGPERSRMNDYAVQLNQLEIRQEEMEDALAMKEDIGRALDEQLHIADGEDFFYQELDSVDADLLIQEMAEAAGIRVLSVSLTGDDIAAAETVTAEPDESGSGGDETAAAIPLNSVTTVVNVTGSIPDIMEFAETVHSLEQAAIISELDIREHYQAGEAEGSVTIVFYSLNEEADERGE